MAEIVADLDPWYSVLAEDYHSYSSGAGFAPADKDVARAGAEALLVAFPGFHTEVHLSFVSADCRYVAFYWTTSGTFSGPLGDIPPTGKEGAVSGITIVEVEDGKILNEWISYDQLTLLTSIGIMGGEATPEAGN